MKNFLASTNLPGLEDLAGLNNLASINRPGFEDLAGLNNLEF
jgi:hypothetical protein